jgi:hypothetical protein
MPLTIVDTRLTPPIRSVKARDIPAGTVFTGDLGGYGTKKYLRLYKYTCVDLESFRVLSVDPDQIIYNYKEREAILILGKEIKCSEN